MILHQLKIFQTVAKQGGFSRASKDLHLSQPGISISIKKLEEELGVSLFERLGRSIQLTPAGRIVEEHVGQLMDILAQLQQAVDGIKGLQLGQLRCGAATTVGIYLLPKLLVQFKQRFPKIETHLLVERSATIEEKILANELDIGFLGDSFGNSSRLETRASFQDELVMIVPRDHEVARHTKISAKKFCSFPLILGPKESHTRKIIETRLDAAGVPHQCAMEVENTEVIKAAVAAGLGVSIISRARVQQEVKAGLLKTGRVSGVSIERQFKVVVAKNRPLSSPAQSFLELVIDHGLYGRT
jgi:DNA-binding transcriptional LysR family regulator